MADASGEEVSATRSAHCSGANISTRKGPLRAAAPAALRVAGRDVKVPLASADASGDAYAEAVAKALPAYRSGSGVVRKRRIPAGGETAVFVGCRVGEQAVRFGVAVSENAAQAVVDMVVERSESRMQWPAGAEAEAEKEAVAA